jgi:hypothetical protein
MGKPMWASHCPEYVGLHLLLGQSESGKPVIDRILPVYTAVLRLLPNAHRGVLQGQQLMLGGNPLFVPQASIMAIILR